MWPKYHLGRDQNLVLCKVNAVACNCTQDNLMQWYSHSSSLQASRELRHLVAFSQLVYSISNKQNIIPITQRKRDHRPTAVGIQVHVICWKQDLCPHLHGTCVMADKSWDPLGKAVSTLANKEGTTKAHKNVVLREAQWSAFECFVLMLVLGERKGTLKASTQRFWAFSLVEALFIPAEE